MLKIGNINIYNYQSLHEYCVSDNCPAPTVGIDFLGRERGIAYVMANTQSSETQLMLAELNRNVLSSMRKNFKKSMHTVMKLFQMHYNISNTIINFLW